MYVFHSRPRILRVRFLTSDQAKNGNFKLCVKIFERGSIETTHIPYYANNTMMKNVLESLPHIGEIKVQRNEFYDNQSQFYVIEWILVFLTFFHDEMVLSPIWKNSGCSDCDRIQGTNDTHINPMIETEILSTVGEFSQEWALQGRDGTSGDYFGYSIDLDKNEAIVGAVHSSAKTRTTWDFETGTLIGWTANGNAFDYQPVFGDNSKRRMVYKGFGKPESKMSGFPQSALI